MITIRALKLDDSKNISFLHKLAFENFFLTSLGIKFLKVFYSSIIKSNQGIAIGAFDDSNELVGFAIGTKNKKGFYTKLLKDNFIALSYSALKSLLLNPTNISRLVKSFLTKETLNDNYISYATLLSICVDPDKKGQNIGKYLLQEFEYECRKYNEGITLTTDRFNNDYVNNFYISNNYILINKFFQGKREMNFYCKQLIK